jgi:protein-disulfide isomerase/uncharacterized membrane protein
MEKVVADFLHNLRVPVSRQECLRVIRAHPDYPALVSVSDALDSFGVDNYVAQFDDDELSDIAFPYLTYLEQPSGSSFVLLRNQAELAEARTRPNSKWTGIIVQANGMRVPPSLEQLTQYQQERKLARLTRLVLGSIVLLLAQPAWELPNWFAAGSYLVALTGLVISVLLMSKELGVAPKLVDDFCGSGPKAGCDEVLASDPVRLFGFFTLTDAALTYFLWQVGVVALVALAPGASQGLYAVSSLVTLLGIPVVGFSLYQQYWVVKAWCRLCLLLDAVLLLQAGLSLSLSSAGKLELGAITLPELLNAGLGLLACGGLLCLLKHFAKRGSELQQSESLLQRDKNSVSLLASLLTQQPRADTTKFDQELMIGSADAPLEIIMVSNPYCAPCKKGHEQITQLVALYPDKLRARFRLVRSGVDNGRFPTTNHYLVEHWLTHIHGLPDESARTSQLLHEWYEHMNLERFAATHPADFSGDYRLSTELIEQHYRWKVENNIVQTPTYFLNGYLLPANYQLSQLKLMLPGLAEYFSAESQLALTVTTS